MAILAGDTFDNPGATVSLNGWSATGPNANGATWAYTTGQTSVNAQVEGANAGQVGTPSGSGRTDAILGGDAGNAHQRITYTQNTITSGSSGWGPLLRGLPASGAGYWSRFRPGNQVFEVRQVDGNLVDSAPLSLSAGDHVFVLEVETVNGDPVFRLTVDDVPRTWSGSGGLDSDPDSSGSKTTDANRMGFSFQWDVSSKLKDVLLEHAPFGSGDSITLTDLDDFRVYQRGSANSADIAIAGTYSGSPTAIEYRLVDFGTSTPVTGHDWQTLDASPTGGNFSGTASAVPTGGRYTAQVRFSNDTGIVSNGSAGWSVGAMIAVLGQSNARRFFEDHTTLSLVVNGSEYTGVSSGSVGTWRALAHNGSIAIANTYVPVANVPVGLLKFGVGSTALVSEADSGSGYWLNFGSAPYATWASAITALGGKLEAVVWMQGETEGNQGSFYTEYLAGLGTLRARIASDASPRDGNSSIPFIIAQTGRDTRGGTTDANWDAVRDAQKVYADSASDCFITSAVDVGLADGVHYDANGASLLGERIAHGVFEAQSLTSVWPPARVVSIAPASGTTTTVTITAGAGSDFTPTTGITGWEVDLGSGWVSATGARASATSITLTHAAGTATAVRYQSGAAPNVSAPVRSNTLPTQPLMPVSSLVAQATLTTAPAADETGAPVSGLTGCVATIQALDGTYIMQRTGIDQETNRTFIVPDVAGLAAGTTYIINVVDPTTGRMLIQRAIAT